MKLRNKKTGEIIDAFTLGAEKSVWKKQGKHFKLSTDDWCKNYNSLAELNEEWEDYEEPKGYYYVTTTGLIKYDDTPFCAIHKDRKEIGNYFSSREEAELAVRKLKAWKRLKNKGFRFTLTPGVGSLDVDPGKFQIEINADMPAKWFCCDAVQEDLDDCFGGEE